MVWNIIFLLFFYHILLSLQIYFRKNTLFFIIFHFKRICVETDCHWRCYFIKLFFNKLVIFGFDLWIILKNIKCVLILIIKNGIKSFSKFILTLWMQHKIKFLECRVLNVILSVSQNEMNRTMSFQKILFQMSTFKRKNNQTKK